MNRDEMKVTALLDELAAIESRLDPQSHSRHRRTADLITVATLLPVTVALDWHADRPLLMLGAMVTALFLNRIPQWATHWRLRREQERLFREYDRLRELPGDDSGNPPVGSGEERPKPHG